MATLEEIPPEPHATEQEQLLHGETLFNTLWSTGAATPPPLYIDLQLHNVDTGDPAKEKNSHGHGTNFDTPSLHALRLAR